MTGDKIPSFIQPQAQTSDAAQPAPLIGDPAPGQVNAGSQWDTATKRTVVVVLLVTGVFIVWVSRPVLNLLVIGGIVAYLLSPIVDLCERLRIPRGLTTLFLFLLLLVGLVLTPILVFPVIVAQLSALTFDVPSTAVTFVSWMQQLVANIPAAVDFWGFTYDLSGIRLQLQSLVSDLPAQLLPTPQDILNLLNQAISTTVNLLNTSLTVGVNVVGSVFSLLLYLLVLFFVTVYLTKDAPQIRAYVESLFPEAYQSEWVDLLKRIGRIWQAFFRGQIVLSLTIGVVTWVALTLAGMPGALILAILAGALEIIPNLGPILAMVPALIVALIQGSTVLTDMNNLIFALLIMGVYFVIQQLENNLIVPRIIGGFVNLHPLIIVLGVVVGANVGGLLGAFLAAPTIASLRVVGSYVYVKLLDVPVDLRSIPPNIPVVNQEVYRRVVWVADEEERSGESAQAERESAESSRGDSALTSLARTTVGPSTPTAQSADSG